MAENGRKWPKKVHRGYLVGNGFSRSTRHSPTTLYLCFCLCSYHSLIFIIHSPPDELDCVFSYRFIFHKEINEIRMISSFFALLFGYLCISLLHSLSLQYQFRHKENQSLIISMKQQYEFQRSTYRKQDKIVPIIANRNEILELN